MLQTIERLGSAILNFKQKMTHKSKFQINKIGKVTWTLPETNIEFIVEGYVNTGLRGICSKEELLHKLNEYKGVYHTSLLPFTMKELSFFCNPNHDVNKKKISLYERFEIDKKSGGTRQIDAPKYGRFKAMLKMLSLMIEDSFTAHHCAFGFTRNLSIVDNAKIHLNKKFLFNSDIKDFFHSIDRQSIKLNLRSQLKGTSEKMLIEFLISCISTFENENGDFVLPQGSPLSPMLSNVVCFRLDEKLFILAKKFGVDYSRYADDLSFSSNHFAFGAAFKNELKRILQETNNFYLNPKKTRLQKYNQRQEVTGLTVNEKPNVSSKYIQDLRRDLYYFSRYGLNSGLLIHGKRDGILDVEEYKRAKDFINSIKMLVAPYVVLKGSGKEYRRNYLYVWVNKLLKLKMDNAKKEFIDALYYYDFGNLHNISSFDTSKKIPRLNELLDSNEKIDSLQNILNFHEIDDVYEINLVQFRFDLLDFKDEPAALIDTKAIHFNNLFKSKKQMNIHGRLSFLAQIKGGDDDTYLNLKKKYFSVFKDNDSKESRFLELKREIKAFDLTSDDVTLVFKAYANCFNLEASHITIDSIARDLLKNWKKVDSSKLENKLKHKLLKIVSTVLSNSKVTILKPRKNDHDAQTTIAILSMFSLHSVYKYFTHNWTPGVDFLESYQSFITKTEDFKNELKKLKATNNDLYKICYQFALQYSDKFDYGWGPQKIKVGWKYPDGLMSKLIDEDGGISQHHNIELIPLPVANQMEIKDFFGKNDSIRTIGDFINHFKNIIQFRGSNFLNTLARLCRDHNKNFKTHKDYNLFPNPTEYRKSFKECLGGPPFFTNTHKITKAIDKIFGCIVGRELNGNQHRGVELRLSIIKKYDSELNYYQFKIIHKGFEEVIPDLEQNMNLRGLGGDTKELIDMLEGLCDFSYESKFIKDGKEKMARINYLVQGEKFIQGEYQDDFKEKCIGFTYVMEFPIVQNKN